MRQTHVSAWIVVGFVWAAVPAFAADTAVAAAPTTLANPSPAAAPWDISIGGFLQSDGVLLDQAAQDQLAPASGEPLNTARFLIRRAHLFLEAHRSIVGGVIEMDVNTVKGMSAGLARAEVIAGAVRPSWEVEAGLGLVRIPFGLELQEWEPDRYFLERSNVSRALFPGSFDLGGRARGSWRFLRAQVALMNGHPLGDASFPARDPNGAKDIVGRLGIDTVAAGKIRVRLGASSLKGTGFHPGTPSTKDVLYWRDQNEDGIVELSEIQVIAGRAATPSQNFSRFAVGADARVDASVPRLGAMAIFGEVVWAANLDRALVPADPVASGRDLREFGWAVGASQEITRHAAVGLRYDFYNPDVDGFRQTPIAIAPKDLGFRAWTATIALGGMSRNRLVLEYQHNRNALAIASDGSSTTLAADTLMLRGQVAFR
jgi:hypothetical protein